MQIQIQVEDQLLTIIRIELVLEVEPATEVNLEVTPTPEWPTATPTIMPSETPTL